MARSVLNRGSTANDGTGDNLREGADKINANFSEIYSVLGDGDNLLTEDIDFGQNKIFFSNTVARQTDLASLDASKYAGMIVHAQNTGSLYYAHSGTWRKLLTDNSSNSVPQYTDPLDNVAYTGNYNDLSNRPAIPSRLTDVGITDGSAGQVLTTDGTGNFTFRDVEATSINFNNITNRPTTIAGYGINDAFTGRYEDLLNKPTLFSGNYNDLTNKPAIPLDIEDLTDNSSLLFDGEYTSLNGRPSIPTDVSELTDSTNRFFSRSYNDLTNKPNAFEDLVSLSMQLGVTVDEFSNDIDMTDNSATALVTERAVKTYVANQIALIPGVGNTFDTLSVTNTSVFNDNIYGGTRDRLWLGGGDSEGTPSINIPNEADGAAQPISIDNLQGGGIDLNAYGATNDYTSSVTLGDDFGVDTNNSSMSLEGTGAWRIGSNNFDHNVGAIDPENDPGIGITVGNDLWIFNNKLSKVSSGDLVLSVDSGDSSVYDWNFGTDGVTNIPGALTFPDGTVQSTAYTGNTGTPLWVVVNVTGEVSFSEDNGINWTAVQTITSGGNPVQGVIRVTIGPDNIVYLADDSGGNTTVLYYGIGMSYNVTQVDPDIPSEADPGVEGLFDWRDIEYAGGYYIVVGQYVSLTTPADTVYPVMYYSTDGINWIQGSIDPGYVASVDTRLRSVDYDGTGWLIIGGEGGFYITSPSEELTESNYTPIADPVLTNPDRVAYTGTQWVVRNGNTVYFAPAGNPLATVWTEIDLAPIMIEEFGGDRPEENPLELNDGLTEMAGGEINGEYWFVAGTSNGQILATKDGGSNWYGQVPQAYTGTVLDIASDSSSTIILIDWDRSPLRHGNKITITGAAGATELNGTYYVESTQDQAEWILWQNSDFTGPVDSSGWGTYAGTSATITFYKGTYFDGLAFGGGKFVAANDDEQLFSVSDVAAGEWIKVNDQNNTFDYWDDIDYYANFGAGTAAPSNRLVSGNMQVSLDSTGRLILPGSVVLDTVSPATYTDTPIALDLNTTVQKVVGGASYTLANGYEGQIMYFVCGAGGTEENVYITLNARMMANFRTVNEYTDVGWILFDHRDAAYYDVTPSTDGAATSMYTAIFTDGYWNVSGGIRD